MKQYRKKPIIVEAEQWHGPMLAGMKGVYLDATGYYVITIHLQRAYLDPGDWVITEPDGAHHYPCKADVFERTYEAVG